MRCEPEAAPLECVACIVLLTFASLAAANFGAYAVGCTLCSCGHLGTAACAATIKGLLYLVIALMPVLAVCVFEVCKALCTGVAGGAAIELLAALRPAVG